MKQTTYQHIFQLILELVLVVALVTPLFVYAGVFSLFFDTVTAQTMLETQYVQESNAQTMTLLRAATHTDPNLAKGGGDIVVEDGALVPSGDIDGKDEKMNTHTANGEISVYIVREGDTLSQIAAMFDVSAKTILWANDISNPSKIRPNDPLIILPITGVRHIVKSGDTLKSIAKKYSGDIEDIIAYNQLESIHDIQIGDTVVIPDGTISTPQSTSRSRAGSGVNVSGGGSAGFTHPLPGAVRTQGIHGYNGVDLASPAGTPIVAAASGEVLISRSSGWNGGYGLYVVVKHSNGTQTLYAHLSRTAVAVGNKVSAGQTIGYVGNTGRSTGNHLHFEVRGARNPF